MGLPAPDLDAPRQAPPPGRPYRTTYIVQRQQWVKIGRTRGPVKARLAALRQPTANVVSPPGMDWRAPLRLLVTITGDVEAELHERFARHHVVGEWFRAEPEMLAAIEAEVSA